eukprot:GEMP01068033.1.p1 GENE.GEMP01068033.1~~GEMP01068033.1.p1  ORF type:complete len:150 (+),score=35.35 GEMP01068033.1:66-515(+)
MSYFGSPPLRHEKSSYDNMEIPDTKPLGEWNLQFEERQPTHRPDQGGLERHGGAKRETKPAWMTKGVGVGQKMFGEPTGMIKPGDNAPAQPPPAFDPMGEVYRSAMAKTKSSEPRSRSPRRHRSRSASRRRSRRRSISRNRSRRRSERN